MNRFIQTGIDAACKAGNYILKYPISTIDEKPDRSKMTDLDIKSEKIIIDSILNTFPDHGVLSEEYGSIPGKSSVT